MLGFRFLCAFVGVCGCVCAGKSWRAQISRIEFIVVEDEGVGTCNMHAFHAQMLRCQLKNPSKKVKRNVFFFSSLQPNATRSRSARPFHQIIIYYRSLLHGIAHRILGNVCVCVFVYDWILQPMLSIIIYNLFHVQHMNQIESSHSSHCSHLDWN